MQAALEGWGGADAWWVKAEQRTSASRHGGAAWRAADSLEGISRESHDHAQPVRPSLAAAQVSAQVHTSSAKSAILVIGRDY